MESGSNHSWAALLLNLGSWLAANWVLANLCAAAGASALRARGADLGRRQVNPGEGCAGIIRLGKGRAGQGRRAEQGKGL